MQTAVGTLSKLKLGLVIVLAAVAWAQPVGASGVGFDEVPEPDELPTPPPTVARYTLSIGPRIAMPRAHSGQLMRRSVGMSARGLRWLSPRFALALAGSFTAMRLHPLVPPAVRVSQYNLAVGARTATAWSRRIGLHAEALLARHSLRIVGDGPPRANHAVGLVFGGGAHIRVASDLLLELRGSLVQADTYINEGSLPIRETTIEISISYEL